MHRGGARRRNETSCATCRRAQASGLRRACTNIGQRIGCAAVASPHAAAKAAACVATASLPVASRQRLVAE